MFLRLCKKQVIEPLFVLAQFAFEPFRKLPNVINELPVQVLEAPLNLALVLKIRRTRRISLNTTLTAPFLPLLVELAAVIRKNSLRSLSCSPKTAVTSAAVNSQVKPFTTNLSTSFNAQTCPNAVLKSLTASAMPKASAEGSIVITLVPGLTMEKLQAQRIRSRPCSVHFSCGNSAHYKI
jgi:hypothetical protein